MEIRRSWRILIVEDEALLAAELVDRLTLLGHRVVAVVDTGQAAVEAASDAHPDLAMMDVRIKGAMNGIETANRIFSEFGVPVIFTSAHSDPDTLRQAEIPGQYGYVIKPYAERDLVMAIRLAMNRREAEGAAAVGKSELLADMTSALGRDEFVLHIQPIVDIRTSEVVKAEALLRWRHPGRGLIPPLDFIPLLEETGLIHEVGEWAFDETLAIANRTQERCGRVVPISVNLSALQLQHKQAAVDWDRKLASLHLQGQLGVELTESVLVSDPDLVQKQLQTFQTHGLPVSVDDFGTGYSSLSYLQMFSLDYLKIDVSFTQAATNNNRAFALTESIIDLAHKMNVKTIAEGIETEDQQRLLASLGCDLAQGYYFSKPLPVDAFLAYVNSTPIHPLNEENKEEVRYE